STPYFSIAIRSGPIPKANPVYLSVSYPAISRTFGCTIPAPNISIQPVFLHTEQPSPPHTLHEISISTEGSVNGKKLGRSRISRSAPNICFANSLSVPFKSLIRTCSSIYNPSITLKRVEQG